MKRGEMRNKRIWGRMNQTAGDMCTWKIKTKEQMKSIESLLRVALIMIKPSTMITIKPLKELDHPFAKELLDLHDKLMLPAFINDADHLQLKARLALEAVYIEEVLSKEELKSEISRIKKMKAKEKMFSVEIQNLCHGIFG